CYFRRVGGPGHTGHAVADLDPAALAPLLADPDAPFADPDRAELKASRSSAVVELPFAGRRVIFKRFSVTAWSDPLVALARPTPALRSFTRGHALRLRGLPTPRPLAVWHRVRHGLPREGYLLVEKVPEAVDLGRLVRRLLAHPTGQARLRALIDEVARLV